MFEVEDILQKRHFSQKKSMADTVAAQNGGGKMICISGLSTMRTQQEGIEPSKSSPCVQRCNVCEKMVDPVTVWGVLCSTPLSRNRELLENSSLNFALIVNAIESYDPLQEDMKLWMTARIFGNFKERLKHILNNLLKAVHQARRLVHVKQSRDLNEPPDIWREQLVVDYPCSQLVPLIDISAIDGNPPLYKLILTRLEIGDDFSCYFCKILTFYIVVRLEEYSSESGFAYGVVLQVEFVESVE